MIEWAVLGQDIPWKPLAFPPRPVVLGRQTRIKLVPNLQESDRAALFHERLNEDPRIFTWLEQHGAHRYDAFIDIGANVGFYSVFMSAVMRHAPGGKLKRIYAFEPDLTNFRRLLTNLEINGAQGVDAFALAISDETGFSTFYQPEGQLKNGSLSQDFSALFSAPTSTKTVAALSAASLEPLFQRHERMMVKIDAEGYEPQILSALEPLLARYQPDLLVEVLAGVDEQLQQMQSLKGYAFFQFTADGPVRHDRLVANPLERDWLVTTTPADVAGSGQAL